MKWISVAAAAVGLIAGAAQAEVIDAQPGGFEVRRTVQIAAPPLTVMTALTHPERWWNSAHSWSGRAANMRMDMKAGGCWCESLPETRGEVRHMTVIYFDPASTIRLEGGLGPLQQTGASGRLTWAWAEKDGGTQVTWTYDVGGYMRGGLAPVAPAVDGVLAEQMARLKKLLETGKAD
jgi:uncharacterized protein YndB with AHSA1/START domain